MLVLVLALVLVFGGVRIVVNQKELEAAFGVNASFIVRMYSRNEEFERRNYNAVLLELLRNPEET